MTTRTFVLTTFNLSILRSKGYEFLTCGKCGKELQINDKITSHRVTSVRKFFHKACFDSLGSGVNYSVWISQAKRNIACPSSHIKLLNSNWSLNPGHPLCPRRQEKEQQGNCRKSAQDPRLILKHHSIPNLSLWICGCRDFWLRVSN